MKRITVLLLMLLCFVSCNSVTDEIENEVIETNKEYVVSIGMVGEILDVTQVPLTKASGDDLYGFVVYSKTMGDSEYKTTYAYGLFDDINDLKITLLDGYLYKFKTICVIDGKNKIYKNNSVYNYPFCTEVKNEFIYGTDFPEMGSQMTICYLDSYDNVIKPNLYYGEASDFNPSKEKSINIDMLKCMTGMKLNISGLNEGKLEIKGGWGTTYSILAEDKLHELETVFNFSLLSDIWNYEKKENKGTYSKLLSLVIMHKHTNGIEEVLYNQDITFTRNKQTIISFSLKKTETSTTNKISVSLEDAGELQPGEEIVIGGSTTIEE